MVKLKLNRVKRIICPTCKGNGFVKIVNAEDTVHKRAPDRVEQREKKRRGTGEKKENRRKRERKAQRGENRGE